MTPYIRHEDGAFSHLDTPRNREWCIHCFRDEVQVLRERCPRLRDLLARCLDVMEAHDKAHHFTCGISFPLTIDLIKAELKGEK